MRSRLSEETKEIVESNQNIDSSLDRLELMTADTIPPFKDIDLNRATPAQIERYQTILTNFCCDEDITDYSIFPGTDLQRQCAQLQAGKIQEHLASGHESSNAYYYLARAFKVMGETQNQINFLQKTISMDPNIFNAHMELGTILGTQGRFDEAFAHFSEALRLKPASAEAYNNIGNVMAAQDKAAEAVSNFYRALQLNPDFVEAHNNIANVLKSQGKIQEAINHYSKALQIDPDHAQTHQDLGRVFAEQGRLEDLLDMKPAKDWQTARDGGPRMSVREDLAI